MLPRNQQVDRMLNPKVSLQLVSSKTRYPKPSRPSLELQRPNIHAFHAHELQIADLAAGLRATKIGSRLVQRDYLSHASLPSFEPSKAKQTCPTVAAKETGGFFLTPFLHRCHWSCKRPCSMGHAHARPPGASCWASSGQHDPCTRFQSSVSCRFLQSLLGH